MARSTFKVLFYVNGSKEKDGIVPIPKTLWDAKGNRAKGKSAEVRNIN